MKALKLLLCAGIVGLSSVAPVGAHLRAHDDANDVKGGFDIKRSKVETLKLGEDVPHFKTTVRTHNTFKERDLSFGAFFVDLDLTGDSGRDFYVRIDNYEGSYPIGDVYRDSGTVAVAGSVTVGDNSVSCTFQRGPLDQEKHLRWKVRTIRNQVKDAAPNGDWYNH